MEAVIRLHKMANRRWLSGQVELRNDDGGNRLSEERDLEVEHARDCQHSAEEVAWPYGNYAVKRARPIIQKKLRYNDKDAMRLSDTYWDTLDRAHEHSLSGDYYSNMSKTLANKRKRARGGVVLEPPTNVCISNGHVHNVEVTSSTTNFSSPANFIAPADDHRPSAPTSQARSAGIPPSSDVTAAGGALTLDWHSYVRSLTRIQTEDKRRRRMKPLYDLHGGSTPPAVISQGMQLFNYGMILLDKFSLVRSLDQRRFHDAIMMTVAPHILKDDYLSGREALFRRFKRTSQNMATLILCPRRWGKSTSVAMALAVLLIVCRGINIVIFSTGADSSSTLLQMTKDFFLQLPKSAERITVNRKHMLSTTPANADKRKSSNLARCRSQMACNTIMSRSGNVTGNRGITADCFILEEAAYIPQGILTQIIAPMLKVSNSVLIALSTHQGEENYYSKLFHDKDPEMDRLFIRLHIELICTVCKKLGKSPGECAHVAHLNPSWLLSSNEGRVKKLMGDDEETYAREVLGAFWSNADYIFQPKWISVLQRKPARPVHARQVLFILTMIDPAGGGDSRTAICSVAYLRSKDIVILGVDEANILEGPQQESFLRRYFLQFHPDSDALFKETLHYIVVERNYGGSLMAATFLDFILGIIPSAIEYQVDFLLTGTTVDPTCTSASTQNLRGSKLSSSTTTTKSDSRSQMGKHTLTRPRSTTTPSVPVRGMWTSTDVNRSGVNRTMWALHDDLVHFAPVIVISAELDPVQDEQHRVEPNTDVYSGLPRHLKPSPSPDKAHLQDGPKSADCTPTERALKRKDQLLLQLGQFRKMTRGGTSSGNWYYSGKNKTGNRDDMAMCFIISIYYSQHLEMYLSTGGV